MRFNLVLCVIWLIVAVPVLLVNLTSVRIEGVPVGRDSLIVGSLAALLAGYNFIRWYAGRMMARTREKQAAAAMTKRYLEPRPKEYNPEFDFDRPGPQTLPMNDEPKS